MNPARWTNSPEKLWTKPATKPFLDVSKFIRCKRPKVVILENVKSLSHGSDKIPAPIEFVMNGTLKVKCEGKARKVEVGLALIPGYKIHDAIFNAMDCGLPHKRERQFIIMFRTDVLAQDSADGIASDIAWSQFLQNVALLKTNPMPRGHVKFFLPDGGPIQPRKKQKCGNKSLKKQQVCKDANLYRSRLGLAKKGQRGGQPFEDAAPEELLNALLPREIEVMNIAHLKCIQLWGEVPEDLVVDVSQGLKRQPKKPKCDGLMFTPTVSMKLVYKYRIAQPKELWAVMGWPLSNIDWPKT